MGDTIYNQHREFYRYQDKLRWNRFQTVAAIEAGILVAVQQNPASWKMLTFFIFAAVLVLLATTVAWRDGVRAEDHMKKIQEHEREDGLSERGGVTGAALMTAVIVVINVFNWWVVLPYLNWLRAVCVRG